jgi:hypothetical protein
VLELFLRCLFHGYGGVSWSVKCWRWTSEVLGMGMVTDLARHFGANFWVEKGDAPLTRELCQLAIGDFDVLVAMLGV